MFNILKIIFAIIVIGGVIVFYLLVSEDNKGMRRYMQGSDIIEQDNTSLSFGKSGRVSKVNVAVGDAVSKGQLLAMIENEQILKELENAKHNLTLQKKILNELESGITQGKLKKIEEQKIKLGVANNLLDDAKTNLILILNEALNGTRESIKNNIDQFINDPTSANPSIVFSIDDSNLETKIKLSRIATEFILDNWSDIVADLTVEDDLVTVSAEAKNKLEQIGIFLDTVSFAVNSLTKNSDLSQETINGYISDVLIAQADLDKAIADILSAQADVKEAELIVALEQQIFEEEVVGTNYNQIIIQEGIVKEAEATVTNIQTEITETYIVATSDGVVTEQAVKVGDTVSQDEIVIVIAPQENTITTENLIESSTSVTQTNTSPINTTYFGPKGPDDPITIELQNGEILELWPGWR